MEWISINEKVPNDGDKIIVWQYNLVDPESSRHHCAIYYQGNDIGTFIIYPTVFRSKFTSKNGYEGYDLEGDKCRLTHWMVLPKKP